MREPPLAPLSDPDVAGGTDGDRLLYMSDICTDLNVTDRCVRNWVASGRFPAPDGNLNGRNFWFRSTRARWKADLRAGKYRVERIPSGLRPGSRAA
jgi:hypothetical protein